MDIHSIKKKLRPMYVPVLEKMLICKKRIVREILLVKIQFQKPIKILSTQETIRLIKQKKCSISRYGDGEINIMLNEGNTRFQERSQMLADALQRVFSEENNGLLICLPRCVTSLAGMKSSSAHFWKSWMLNNGAREKLFAWICITGRSQYCFGDAMITRPYMDWKHGKRAEVIFKELKTIWDSCDLLIVEGAQTRLGIGNDLFANANSIKRILVPAINAYDCYDEIKSAVIDAYENELVLLAIGPTATVLAADLSKQGIQALDVGHVDIEYEWFLQSAAKKQAIPGKYTNEVREGRIFSACSDLEYQKQIIKKICG